MEWFRDRWKNKFKNLEEIQNMTAIEKKRFKKRIENFLKNFFEKNIEKNIQIEKGE